MAAQIMIMMVMMVVVMLIVMVIRMKITMDSRVISCGTLSLIVMIMGLIMTWKTMVIMIMMVVVVIMMIVGSRSTLSLLLKFQASRLRLPAFQLLAFRLTRQQDYL